MKKLAKKICILTGVFILQGQLVLNAQLLGNFGIDTKEYPEPEGLSVGEKAPDFYFLDRNGKRSNLSDELKSGNIVLIFYRGQWCPVCNRHLADLEDSLDLINIAGGKVLAVTPETRENAAIMESKTKAEFIIVSDTTLAIQKAYKVLFKVTDAYRNSVKLFIGTDIAENNGSDEAWLPIPATYIIDTNGIIKYRQFETNYKNRATAGTIIEELNKLK